MLSHGRLSSGLEALGLTLTLTAFACSVQADDTELYIANGLATGQGRPQVLIIFDNSGSMRTEEAVAAQPFDPSVDYTGYGGNRLFYIRGAVTTDNYPNPGSSSEQRYLLPQNNACASSNAPHPADNSYSVLEYEGRFTSNFRYFSSGGWWSSNSWTSGTRCTGLVMAYGTNSIYFGTEYASGMTRLNNARHFAVTYRTN